jgi:hypothetical protein
MLAALNLRDIKNQSISERSRLEETYNDEDAAILNEPLNESVPFFALPLFIAENKVQ